MLKKMIPIVCILLAGIMVVSSGAFSSASSERSSDVSVVGDAEALLSLEPTSPYSRYVDGEIVIDFVNSQAGGINSDAITCIYDVFSISNNGDSDVILTLSKDGENVSSIDFGEIEGGLILPPGDTYSVSVTIDSHGLKPGQNILDSISISAIN